MARHRYQKPALDVSYDITTVAISNAEEMVIIDEKSAIWKTKKLGGRASFVTLKPPPDISDHVVEELKTRLYAEHGARVVHVVSKQKAITVTAPFGDKFASNNLRSVVLGMADEANTKNKPALLKRLEESLAAVGL